jgi:predicted DNA-binding protein with PD1-like motif
MYPLHDDGQNHRAAFDVDQKEWPAQVSLGYPWRTMQIHPIRLNPGQDLRAAIEAVLIEHDMHAAFVLQGIGSLSVARLRFAGMEQPAELHADLEILTLGGSVSRDGAHLHMAVSDGQGRVSGGHVGSGCIVRTTVEVLLAILPAHRFARELDATTGYAELVVRPRPE